MPILVVDSNCKGLTKHGPMLFLRNRLCHLGLLVGLTRDETIVTKSRRRVDFYLTHGTCDRDVPLLEFVNELKTVLPNRLIIVISNDKDLLRRAKKHKVMVFYPEENDAVARLERRRKMRRSEILENLVDAVKKYVAKRRSILDITDIEAVRKVMGITLNVDVDTIRYVKIVLNSRKIVTIDKYRETAEVDDITVRPDGSIIRKVTRLSLDEAVSILESLVRTCFAKSF